MIKGHAKSYLILLLGLCAMFIAFFLVGHDKERLIYLALGGSGFYALWGIAHHSFEGRLDFKIAMEYVLFGILTFLLIYLSVTL